MSASSSQPRPSRRRVPPGLLALLVLAFGLALTAAACLQLAAVFRDQEQERFQNAVEQAQSAVAVRMEAYVAVLRAGAGLADAEGGLIHRAEFDAFARRLELTGLYPGIQGLGFSAVLPAVDGPQTRALLQRLGAPDLAVKPAGARADVHAIVFLQPLDRRNRAALGYDMYSNPVRRAAMARARDTGQAAMSHKVQLVQEITADKQAGFLIYQPVYRGGGLPVDVGSRRASLTGFVYAAFRADDLLNGIFGGQAHPRLHIAVYDREVRPDRLLHKSFPEPPEAMGAQARLTATKDLQIAGERWRVVYYARPGVEAGEGRTVLWVFALGGVLATLLGAGATWWQARARMAAEAEVEVRRAAAEQRELLLGELNHRVKNTLATVQSIAAQTLREGKPLSETRAAFEARLLALSQTHNLLTRSHWTGASLGELAALELAPYRSAEGRIQAEGEEIVLGPSPALALGMALHELATNAAKYGALSQPGGRVRLSWSVLGGGAERRLRLEWRESGGPPVTPPKRRGFGSRLITTGLRRQLAGEVELTFAPEGVRCLIELPLAGREPDPETGWS